MVLRGGEWELRTCHVVQGMPGTEVRDFVASVRLAIALKLLELSLLCIL